MPDDFEPFAAVRADPFAAGDGAISAMDQSSIDGLLGFRTVSFEDEASGIGRLYDQNSVPQTRNAMLEAVFERMGRLLKNSLRKIASDQVEVALNSVTNIRCRSYMESIALPAILAIVKATPWGGSFLIVLSANVVYGLVEATLGGATKPGTLSIEGRAFTAIETRVARRLIDAVIADAQAAFSTVSPVTFALDHIETVPRFISIAPPSSIAATVSVAVQIGELITNVEIFMPLSVLEPIRELLQHTTATETRETDDVWASDLRSEVMRSKAELSVVLHEERFPLSRVMNLKVGDTLLFERGTEDAVELRCGGVSIGYGRAGRSGRRVAFELGTCRPASS